MPVIAYRPTEVLLQAGEKKNTSKNPSVHEALGPYSTKSLTSCTDLQQISHCR